MSSTDDDTEDDSPSLLPLGEPEYRDVEAAAALLARYSREAPLTEAGMRSFLMMVKDPQAVLARVQELNAATKPRRESGEDPKEPPTG
jgi:hypothetical protein